MKYINCEICNEKYSFGECFGKRCPKCEEAGYYLWGFGETKEIERDMEYPVDVQKQMIMIFRTTEKINKNIEKWKVKPETIKDIQNGVWGEGYKEAYKNFDWDYYYGGKK